MVLLMAFVIGSGFILVDTMIQFALGLFYPLKMYFYRELCKWPLRQLAQRMLKKPKWQRPWVHNLCYKTSTIAVMGFEEWRKFQGCWSVFARSLLKQRFGVEYHDFQGDEWQPLYWNLGSMTPEDFRGSVFIIACHATGWAGLVASRIAPDLREKYYLALCWFLILNGFLHAYYVIQRREDPRMAGNLVVRAILREFPKLTKANEAQRESKGDDVGLAEL
jgi:hypothetical protein